MKRFLATAISSFMVFTQTACTNGTTAPLSKTASQINPVSQTTQTTQPVNVLAHTSITIDGDQAQDKQYYQSNVTSAVIASPVSVIGVSAFEQSELMSVDIPETITEIKDRAFADCPLLWDVTFRTNKVPTFGSNVFSGSDKIKFNLPEGANEKEWQKALSQAKGDDKFEIIINGYSNEESFSLKSVLNAGIVESASPYAGASLQTDSIVVAPSTPMQSEADYSLPDFNTEEYNSIDSSGFINVSTQPLSTFAMDVDTGSYTNFRRLVNQSTPVSAIPSGAIRTEEMVNYFEYNIGTQQQSNGKFTVQSELHQCPWNQENNLLMLTVKANPSTLQSTGNNFTYLIDTSGSMDSADKIGLAVESFKRLTQSLSGADTVSIVTYSGSSEVLLDSANAKDDINKILSTLDEIQCWGGTNGSGGIEAAYKLAEKNFKASGNNRVIIASDGDMNLGVTSQSGLVDLITEKKNTGIFLTTLGFGTGNYSDANMEQIADAGNGNYYYIDNIREANRVLNEKLTRTTVTIAKDVKLQVEFNPNTVKSYRLIGYENRELAADEFRDDTVDGGECGAGQQVTVFYEVSNKTTGTEPTLKYQDKSTTATNNTDELLTVSIRYKEPSDNTSTEESYSIKSAQDTTTSEDYTFATAVVGLSELLRKSEYTTNITLDDIKNSLTHTNYTESDKAEFKILLDSLY